MNKCPGLAPGSHLRTKAYTMTDTTAVPRYSSTMIRLHWLTFILVVLAAIWQGYAAYLDNTLVLPTFTETMRSFLARIASGELLIKSWVSIKVLLQGYAIGLALALVFTILAMATRLGNDLLETLKAETPGGLPAHTQEGRVP